MKRLFIGISVDDRIKEKLLLILKELEKLSLKGKIEPIDNIHLTLKFLGNTDENKIPLLNQILKSISEKYPSFIIKLKGFGFFPNAKNPRIFWISTEEDSKIVFQLQNEIENKLSEIGYERENRPFRTHFTLMRIKSSYNIDKLIDKINEFNKIIFDPMEVKCFHLYESILKPQGAEYIILKDFHLRQR